MVTTYAKHVESSTRHDSMSIGNSETVARIFRQMSMVRLAAVYKTHRPPLLISRSFPSPIFAPSGLFALTCDSFPSTGHSEIINETTESRDLTFVRGIDRVGHDDEEANDDVDDDDGRFDGSLVSVCENTN